MTQKEALILRDFINWTSNQDKDRHQNYPSQVVKVAIKPREDNANLWEVHMWTDIQNPMDFHELAQLAEGIEQVSGCAFIATHGIYDAGTRKGEKSVRTVKLY